MNFLSICSGIDAASVAWEPLGWKAVGFSEIEPFPCAVLAHHWPHVPNLGDMTKHQSWENLRDVDLLIGGTPCQAFSVAGLRNSLDDERGNLTLIYINILNQIDEERNNARRSPAICVWENVPGVLNTKDNAFGCFLGGLAGSGGALEPPDAEHGWTNSGYVRGPQRTIAWRILDAQYFGVAQRRRRVFVVASAREGFCPEQILFESDGMRRDFAPSRIQGEGAAGDVGKCIESSDQPVFLDRAAFNQGENAQFAPNINTNGISDALVARGPHAVAVRMAAFCEYVQDETESTMKMRDYKDATDLVVQSQYGDIAGALTARHDSSPCADRGQNVVAFDCKGSQVQFNTDNISPSLRSMNHDSSHANGGGQVAIAIPINTQMSLRGPDTSNSTREGVGIGDVDSPAFTLQAAHCHAVAFSFDPLASNSMKSSNPRSGCREVNLSPCIDTTTPTPQKNQGGLALVNASAVRRLTPTECERLQGFPDGHTLIPWRGNMASDGPRYKALGNSMAVPVIRWIGERIEKINQLTI